METANANCDHCKMMAAENDLLRRRISLLMSSQADYISTQTQTSDKSSDFSVLPVPEHFPKTTDIEPRISPSSDNRGVLIERNGISMVVEPFTKHTSNLFESIDTTKLDNATVYTHNFSNRSVAYYGSYPYSYNNVTHHPKSMSENPVLHNIVKNIREKLPDIDFNSVMLTKYADGKQNIPFHSDNENCISPGSSITTISLGQSRQLRFRSSINNHININTTVSMSHGEVVFMSRLSQKYYEHSIPKDFSKNVRISITLRLIVPPTFFETNYIANNKTAPNQDTVYNATKPSGPIVQSHSIETISSNSGEKTATKSTTVYISSSMFGELDAKKLSSASQDAIVLSYRGATAYDMLSRIKRDKQFIDIEANRVTKIILMCGTNNVDRILHTPKPLWSALLEDIHISADKKELERASTDICKLVEFLHDWATRADIKLVNILPRESSARNQVINKLNEFIVGYVISKYVYTKQVSTEVDRYLFSDRNGFRKNQYFSTYGDDNVHLNKLGVVRLSKHLKYNAHH